MLKTYKAIINFSNRIYILLEQIISMKKYIQYNKCCVLCYQRGTDMLKKHSTEITRTVLKSLHSYSDLASVQGQMKE